MPDPGRTRLLHGPYRSPPQRQGDRATCLYRDSEAVVTGWSSAPNPWPRCRALHQRGGSGLLVNDELKRAILAESAEALKHHFGVSTKAVWAWRRAFGVSQFATDGSQRLHRTASERGAAATRGRPLPPGRVERRQPCPRPGGSRPWAPGELARIGTVPDAELAARVGQTAMAVRVKRIRLGIRPARG
jgi:hypothetical protein